MSELLRQVLIAVAFGAACFGCGYLTGFIVTRNVWRDEMIKRGVARYNWQTGKWEWASRRNRAIDACSPLPATVVGRATGRLLLRARPQRPAACLRPFRG
jgi:hypothetical protein